MSLRNGEVRPLAAPGMRRSATQVVLLVCGMIAASCGGTGGGKGGSSGGGSECESSAVFSGVESVSGVTSAAATLEWTDSLSAVLYIVLDVTSGTPVYRTSVQAPSSSVQLTGLEPGESYRFMVRALDSKGCPEANTASVEVVTDDSKQPNDVSGLVFWLKADAVSGLSDGQSVSAWRDSSSSANDATQANPAKQPVFAAGAVNGLPAVSYDGGRCLVSTSNLSLGDFTVLVVFKDNGAGSAYERLLDHDYVNGFWLGRNNTAADSWGGGIRESSSPYGRFAAFDDAGWNILISRRAGTTHDLSSNGGIPSSGTVSGTTTASGKIGVGCWSTDSGSQALGGQLAEIIVYNEAISSADQTDLLTYLSDKYAITLP